MTLNYIPERRHSEFSAAVVRLGVLFQDWLTLKGHCNLQLGDFEEIDQQWWAFVRGTYKPRTAHEAIRAAGYSITRIVIALLIALWSAALWQPALAGSALAASDRFSVNEPDRPEALARQVSAAEQRTDGGLRDAEALGGFGGGDAGHRCHRNSPVSVSETLDESARLQATAGSDDGFNGQFVDSLVAQRFSELVYLWCSNSSLSADGLKAIANAGALALAIDDALLDFLLTLTLHRLSLSCLCLPYPCIIPSYSSAAIGSDQKNRK